MTQWWSWLLAALGISALFIAAKRPKAGWTFAICVQALWVAYALVTRQYGFLVSAAAYALVYARLLRHSRSTVGRLTDTETTDER